mgnify:FL=1
MSNELEVIGFYFSDHPLNYFPEKFFEIENINSFNEIIIDNMNSAKLAGSVLDIKERSNKDGKKYAFITISEKECQYELTIFSENLSRYRSILKEGNILIFDIDIINNSGDYRFIIKKVSLLENKFRSKKMKFSIYSSADSLVNIKNEVFGENTKDLNNIDVFINIDDKLVSFDFSKYNIKSYKALDDLKNSKKIDYSIEIT